jgi:hypothetical protein
MREIRSENNPFMNDIFLEGLKREAAQARFEGRLEDWYQNYASCQEVVFPGEMKEVRRAYLGEILFSQ